MRRSLGMNARNDPGPAIAAAPPSRNGARRAAGGEAMHVAVIGAGVAGLACAAELAERGAAVEVFECGATGGEGASGRAGARLAPIDRPTLESGQSVSLRIESGGSSSCKKNN